MSRPKRIWRVFWAAYMVASALLLSLVVLSLGGCDDALVSDVGSDRAQIPGVVSASSLGRAGDNAVLIWGEACLQSIRETVQGPPMTARTLAIVHTAMYDAWSAYDADALGTRLGGELRRPPHEHTKANKERAISFAAYRALVDLFPARIEVFDAIMRRLGYDPDEITTDVSTPEGVGNTAAAELLKYRRDDGANQIDQYRDYTGYVPVNPPLDPSLPGVGGLVDPTRWQPLIHDTGTEKVVQSWIVPHWEYVVPFALTSADQFASSPPAPIKSGEWRRQVQEVVNIQARLTDRQKVIAEYWADGPTSEFPPGHWCTIAQYVSRRDAHTLDDDIKLFFLVANAVFDASIAAWTTKIRHDYVRPITAVRYVKAGKKVRGWAGPGLGTRVIDGDQWLPYQPANFRTPPFGEFVSGHSTFSMAAATVMRSFVGSDAYGDCTTFSPGSSKIEPGAVPAESVTLCWKSLTEAAEEAGISRLYGGIHFRQANEAGQEMGRLVGEQVWRQAQSLFTGGEIGAESVGRPEWSASSEFATASSSNN